MEKPISIEDIEQEISEKLNRVRETALDFQEAKKILEDIEILKSTRQDTVSSVIQNLRQKLKASSVIVQTVGEFRILLRKVVGDDEESIDRTIAHENAHAHVAQSIGAYFKGYSLLIAKNGDQFMHLPGADYSYPVEWSEEKRMEADKQILRAPDEYGGELSSHDIQQLERLEQSKD